MASWSQLTYPNMPLFNCAVFYNVDLDISPGFAMSVNGTTFCNGNIWCYPSGPMTFNGAVIVAGKYNFFWDTNGEQAANIAPSPVAPVFNDGNPISHVAPLILPFGGNSAEAMINLPPPGAMAPQQIAYTPTNQMYDFNAASLIVSNWANGTNSSRPMGNNFSVYLQDSSPQPSYVQSNGVPMHWIQLTNDYYVYANSYLGKTNFSSANWVPNFQFTNDVTAIRWTNSPIGTNWVYYAGFSFLTNVTFKDYRESATVQAVQIDVGQLRAWITNGSVPNGGSNWNQELAMDTFHGVNSIYVYNDVPFVGQQQLPAVCLVNGQLLPNSTNSISGTNFYTRGLTVVTPQPLYVIGNYNVQIDGSAVVTGTHNTADTYPAALMADAITILSSNWPSDWSQTSYSSRVAASTTINAACLEGIVPSTGGGDGPNAHYSGGIENFLRLLENWSNCTLTYNGSMVAMFPSVYATNYWQLPDDYYGVPLRNWGFDTNFVLQDHLPALTPELINSNIAPVIIAGPNNEVVLVGQTTNLTVSASGVPAVTYQWSFQGSNIPGQTNASLTLNDLQLKNAGNYAVEVTNFLGSVMSSNALLSVYTSAVPVLGQLSFSPDNGFQCIISGVPGFNYTVETSTNLIDWVPLMTNISPFAFTDRNIYYPQRFYRGVYSP